MNKEQKVKQRIERVNKEWRDLLTRVAFPEMFPHHKAEKISAYDLNRPVGGLTNRVNSKL